MGSCPGNSVVGPPKPSAALLKPPHCRCPSWCSMRGTCRPASLLPRLRQSIRQTCCFGVRSQAFRSAVASACILVVLGEFVSFGTSLKVIPYGSSPLSHEPIQACSGLQTRTSVAPPLNFQEDDSCNLADGVPPNLKWTKKSAELKPYTWAYHKGDEVRVEEELQANQTEGTDRPGRESQAFISFNLPEGAFENGSAILSLFTTGGTGPSNYGCKGLKLGITRMQDDSFRYIRDDSKATTDALSFQIGMTDQYYEVDISQLFYGKELKGQPLHFMIRQLSVDCYTTFSTAYDEKPPKLTLHVLDPTPMDAQYDSWGPYSRCRVSCVSNLNYQCRKRICFPGIGTGIACKAEEMLEKILCTESDILGMHLPDPTTRKCLSYRYRLQ